MAKANGKRRLVRIIDIGGDPIKKIINTLLLLCLLAMVGVLVFVFVGGNIGLIFALLSGLICFYFILTSIADLFDAWNNRGIYRLTKQAISNGFTPTWIAHGEGWNGVVAVDEGKKEVLLNGLIFAFADIRSVLQQNSILMIQAGTVGTPAVQVETDSAADAEEALARLCASLEMPLPTSSIIIA